MEVVVGRGDALEGLDCLCCRRKMRGAKSWRQKVTVECSKARNILILHMSFSLASTVSFCFGTPPEMVWCFQPFQRFAAAGTFFDHS